MVVAAIDEVRDGSSLTVRVGDVDCVVHVDAVADLEAARRWRLAFRRIDHIRMDVSGTQVRFIVSGTGHRLPVRRCIPASAALGLAVTGCPVVVGKDAR